MNSTTEKPTVPGVYWLRLGAYISLVKVEPWKDDGVKVHLDGDPVTMQPGDWVVKYVVKYIGMEVAEPLRQEMGEWTGPLEKSSLS